MTAPRPGPGPGAATPEASAALADALAQLDGLPQRPVHEHVAAYDEVHQLLQAELAALDGV